MGEEQRKIPDTFVLLDKVNEIFEEGISRACGKEFISVIREDSNNVSSDTTKNNWRSNSLVRIGDHWKKYGDFQCSCANAIFCQFTGKPFKLKRKKKKKKGQVKPNIPPTAFENTNELSRMEVTTVSEFGLSKVRVYRSPKEVAEEIVACLPEEKTKSLISGIQISDSGCIVLTTQKHLQWHLMMGRLPCPECGQFLKGARGLRMHQMAEHGIVYAEAEQKAKNTEKQVVLYKAQPDIILKWQAELEKNERARDDLRDSGLEAARSGDLETLENLVEMKRWDPCIVTDKHGSTAMMWAAGEGHLNVCKFLVDHCNVDVNELRGPTKKRRHALHWAARNGHIPVCEWLVLEKQVDVDLSTDDGTAPLHFAVWTGNLEMVRWLIEVGQCAVNKKNYFGCNASQWCALNGNLDVLRYLHAQGLDVKVLNRNGHSALHKAATKGQAEVCKWLLKPEKQDGGGLGLYHLKADEDGCTPSKLAFDNHFPLLGAWLSSCTALLMQGSEFDKK